MPSILRDICFDCSDHLRVARFWGDVLGYEMEPEEPSHNSDVPIAIVPPDSSPRIWFSPVPEVKAVKNRVHIDINLPDDAELDRLKRLGARTLREIRDDQGVLHWTVMADPEGNEFCAFPPARDVNSS